jgi:hypothetical protein
VLEVGERAQGVAEALGREAVLGRLAAEVDLDQRLDSTAAGGELAVEGARDLDAVDRVDEGEELRRRLRLVRLREC